MKYWKYGRIKKRVFVVLALCLLALCIPILLLQFYLTDGIKSNNIADFTIGEPSSDQRILGLGINADNADDGNYILNNSFEPLVYCKNLIINSGDENTMKIEMSDDPQLGEYPNDFFIGSKATVSTIDQDGKRKLKKTGIIHSYLTDQIDEFFLAELPPDLPQNIDWLVIANYTKRVLIGGTDGYILIFDSLSEPVLTSVPSKQMISGIFDLNDELYAIDIAGNLFQLKDDQNWKFLYNASKISLNKKIEISELDSKQKIIKLDEENISDTNKETIKTNIIKWTSAASTQDKDGNWQYMLVGENGHYAFGNSESIYHNQLKEKININAVTANYFGFYLIGDQNYISFTKNGEQFRNIDLSVSTDWQAISSRDSEVLIVGSQGQIAYSQDGLVFQSLNNDDIREISIKHSDQNQTIVFNPNFISCSILSNEQLLLIDDQGLLYHSNDLGKTWKQENISLETEDKSETPEKNKIDLIQYLSTGHLIASDEKGQILFTVLSLSIELDGPLEDGIYQNGDVIQIEQLSEKPIFDMNSKQGEQISGEWYVSNPDQAEIQFSERASGQGRSALKINLDEENKNYTELTGLYTGDVKSFSATDDFVILQEIDPSFKEKMNTESLFSYEFWAKSDQKVEIALSFGNLNIDIEPVKNTIQGDWKKYYGAIILPKNSLAEDKTPCFQINLNGEGNIYFDNICVTSSNLKQSEFQANYPEKSIGGETLRIQFTKIGDDRYPSESWLDSNSSYSFFYQKDTQIELLKQNNLVKSMEYCKSVQANPWLIIDSQANSNELKHLMQYLFGSESETYGELRLEQGAVSRYSDIFDQIYIEITDLNGLLINDSQKESYVNWIINVIKETPEYLQVKNKLLFIDGMDYKENIFLSNADYHASDLILSEQIKTESDFQSFNNSLYELFPRDINQSINSRSEFIRSTKLENESLRLSDVILPSLSLLGEEKDATLLDIDLSKMETTDQFSDCFVELGSLLYSKNPLSLNSKLEQDKIYAFAYGSGSKYVIVLINISDETANAQISNINFEGFTELSYDAQGNLLNKRQLQKNTMIFSVLPGYVTILYGEENGK